MTRLNQLKKFFSEAEQNNKSFYTDFIFDKTKIFASIHLKEESLQLFENIFSELDEKHFLPDVVIYLHRPVDELKRNIFRRGRGMESDIPVAYLKSVEVGYRTAFENEKRFPVIWLNCGDIYYQPNDEIFKQIKNLLNQKWEKRLHELDFIEGAKNGVKYLT